MLRKLTAHSETMALTLVLWLCALPLVALVVLPFFGPTTAILAALIMLISFLVICWSLCGWQVMGSHSHERS